MGRFEIVQEPTGLWSVFDGRTGIPAEFNGDFLCGLFRSEAVAAVRRCLAQPGPAPGVILIAPVSKAPRQAA